LPSGFLGDSSQPDAVPGRNTILDPAFAGAIEELTSLLASICGTPICGVSLLAPSGEWFAPSVSRGLGASTPNFAFCDYTARDSQVLVVRDTRKDERFRGQSDAAGEPSLRFYAGIRMTGPTGELIGTLYVLDYKPRTLSHHQRQAIVTLSNQIIAQHRIVVLIQERDASLERLQAAAADKELLEKALRDQETHNLASAHRDISGADALSHQVANTNEYLEIVNRMLVEQQAELVSGHVRLEVLATSDGLTGLKNHRAFQERIAEEFERARRYRLTLSLVLLDVDHFKQFNDVFGHPAGDQALKRLAVIMSENARITDFVARYGGEEFAIVLPETDAAGALVIADRIRIAVACADWDHRKITVSVGVAVLKDSIVSPSALIDQADRALYLSKSSGRDRSTLFQLAA